MAPAGRTKRGRAQGAEPAAPAAAAASDPAPPGGMTALHRWRSPPWAVSPVAALAACPDGTAFAAAYESGRVEVWHLEHLCCLASVPGWESADLSSLAWARDPTPAPSSPGAPPRGRWRLFAGSLDGSIYEVDFTRQQLVHASDSYGGAVWALAARPEGGRGGGAAGEEGPEAPFSGRQGELVAACDDGSLRVLRVSEGAAGCEYVRSMAKVEGRALSLAWHPDGGALVSGGSDGCIHVWEAESGRELLRITAAAQSASPPNVWALAVLPDGTIVSGDSGGATQFWEGRFGTLVSRLQQHAADVTAVAASADGSLVFSAGVDPRVAVFQRVPDAATGSDRWAYLAHKSPHTHEVRALAAAPRGADAAELLLSGGVDGQLVLYPALRVLQEHPVRLTKAPQAPTIQLAPLPPSGTPRLMVAQNRHITLWRLGRSSGGPAGAAAAALAAARRTAGPTAGPAAGALPGPGPAAADQSLVAEGEELDLSEAPACLADLALRGPRHLACAAVSPDGSRLAVSDAAGVRLFRVQGGHEERAATAAADPAGSVERVRRPDGQRHREAPPAVCMAFGADGRSLYCADASGCLHRVDSGSGCVVGSLQLGPERMQLAAARGGAAAGSSSGGDSSDDSDGGGEGGSGSDSDDGGGAAAAAGRRRRRRVRLGLEAGRSTAAAAAQPVVGRLAVSPDGSWLAAASGASVSMVDLRGGAAAAAAADGSADGGEGEGGGGGPAASTGGMAPAGPLLLLWDASEASPVTALEFSQDGSLLAVANAADQVAAYSVSSRAPTEWSAEHWGALGKLLGKLLPGTIRGLSFRPAPAAAGAAAAAGPASVLLHSAGALCHVDMTAPLSTDALSGKRRRGPAKPRAGAEATAAGLNGRVLPLESPCLFLGFIGPSSALLVEKPWEEVLAELPPPLYRHRYGT